MTQERFQQLEKNIKHFREHSIFEMSENQRKLCNNQNLIIDLLLLLLQELMDKESA